MGLRGLVPDERVAEVHRLVLLTAGHDPAPGDATAPSCATPTSPSWPGRPDAYAAYASAVRAEYAHLTDAEFTAGRIAVLEHLLALPALFRTPDAARQWAEPARANLTAELVLLRRRAASGPATPPPAAG